MSTNAEEIARRFDISLQAAKIRVEELARIERSKTGGLRPLPPGVSEFLKEQKRKGFKVSRADLD
ncbi:MAG: hypothetical protein WCG00_04500 [Hyphomicrobiales bacterium]